MIYQKSKAKEIISDKERLNKIVHETIDTMAKAVGATLGPGGRPVLIERDGLSPLATKDGVTVAKSLGLANSEANIIVDAAKEICINTAKQAGDGTTTAIVLANELVKNGQTFLSSNPKYNPQKMINELNIAYSKVIVPFLKSAAIPVDEEYQLKNVATISANGDTETAEIVVEAVMAAGDDGTVLINEGRDAVTRVETVDGYIVTTGLKDIGQIGPAFINDKAGQQVKMDNGYAVLYDGTINDLKVPGAIQSAVADDHGYTDGAPIMVLAHGFADSVLDKFAKSTKNGLTIVPVKTPRSGLPNGASEFLYDMAAYTNGLVYDPGNIETLSIDGLGKFKEAAVNLYETFVSCQPELGAIESRIQELRSIEKAAFSEMDKSFVRAAIAKLTGGVATIIVGGNSDLEIREKKGRVEDAVEAVRSAIAEGIVPGGASMHLRLAKELSVHPDKSVSWDILIESLRAPFNLLMSNCGEDPSSIYEHIKPHVENLKSERPEAVFDANEHKVVDPISAGIIEPAKVVRVSIGNALSVASLLTTLGGIVVVPRDSNLEMQMELANQAFSNMMSTAGEQ
jgi:chaperonin GroEL